MLVRIVPLLAALTFAAHVHAQSTWHVDAIATPPFDGSAAQPFDSIQSAIDSPLTQPDDTVLVAPGVYQGFNCAKRLTIESTAGPMLTAIEPVLANATVWFTLNSNSAKLRGFTLWAPVGGFAVQGADTVVERCILLGLGVGSRSIDACGGGTLNHCWASGFDNGVISDTHCSVNVRNSIFWTNDIDIGGYAEYVCYGNASWGTLAWGSVQGDPRVYDSKGHDFHLKPGSPCIDAGDPAAPLDPDGSRADIGPLPFDPTYEPYLNYCTAQVNSQGCTPDISAIGTPSVTSPRPFWVRSANQLTQVSGLMFYGYAPASTPYQGGFLCVAPPTRRMPVLNAGGVGVPGCAGVFAYDFAPRIQSGVDAFLTLGREVYFQFWSRDALAVAGSNRSSALRARITP